VHIGQPDTAAIIHNAWLKTLEDGIHTYDIFKPNVSKEKVGTKEFARAIIERLGQLPRTFTPVHYTSPKKISNAPLKNVAEQAKKDLMGVDIFVDSKESVDVLHNQLEKLSKGNLKLTMISNRGARIWPERMPEVSCGDSWRCRFMSTTKGQKIVAKDITLLLSELVAHEIDFTHTEALFNFNGKPGYTVSQEDQ
jgi:isocitrate dehydrogenase